MTDPARLLDDGADAFERAVIGSAKHDREPADGAARALAALGLSATAGVALSGSATPSTTVATSTSSLLGGSLTVKIAVLGLLASSVLAAIVLASLRSAPDPLPVPGRSPPSATSAVAVADESARSSSVEPDPRVALAPVAVADLPTASTSPPPNRRPRTVASRTIADELVLLDAARASLAGGDDVAAERALGAYDARFGDGVLKLEAKIARIELYLARAEHDRAADLCERFLREHPRTAFERRVRALLARARPEATKEK